MENDTNQTERKDYQVPELVDLSVISTAIGDISCGAGSSGSAQLFSGKFYQLLIAKQVINTTPAWYFSGRCCVEMLGCYKFRWRSAQRRNMDQLKSWYGELEMQAAQ